MQNVILPPPKAHSLVLLSICKMHSSFHALLHRGFLDMPRRGHRLSTQSCILGWKGRKEKEKETEKGREGGKERWRKQISFALFYKAQILLERYV
jgi:hypothetical protein